MRASIVCGVLLSLVACQSESPALTDSGPVSFHPDGYTQESLPDHDEILMEEAVELVLRGGVDEDEIVYTGFLPYVLSEEAAQGTWGVITHGEDGLRVSYVDMQTAELIAFDVEAPSNIVEFVVATGLLNNPYVFGAAKNSYDSFPWSWRLPMEAGTFTLTSGYGSSSTHSGSTHYATDWANGSSGHLLEASASGWVMYRNTSYTPKVGYGYQMIVESGPSSGSKEYYFRIAHMNAKGLKSAGTWIGKGTNLGYIGSTGDSSGAHVHFEALEATSVNASGVFSGATSLPINKWPSAADSICDGDYSGYNFAGSPRTSVTVATTGCL